MSDSGHGPVRIIYTRPSGASTSAPVEPGYLSHGGGLMRAKRPFACVDCGATLESTSPNARRCPVCAKARTRNLQAAWMRQKRKQG